MNEDALKALFDREVQFPAFVEAGTEPSVRMMIVSYYSRYFNKADSEALADSLITALVKGAA